MKLECLEFGSADCPLIRIYGSDREEFSLLYTAILQLAHRAADKFELHAQPFVTSLGGCKLTLVCVQTNRGIYKIDDRVGYLCSLSQEKWLILAQLIEPFCNMESNTAFQWLLGNEARHGLDIGKIGLLISNFDDGRW